ncbi:FAD-dependent oxidoreductase [Ruegeria sp. 2012CJ41-6]|uniref:FAD-dependent oxidoreductase n=1 Tax=Ruegeria spongiae TaxID=2942209 RepID=A0ABT0Q2P7_9RHOB|nr:FAD-dependent oxidoreductase [Ruegeria spongiae]MCL6284146.1 FAD-dependent oxidoreductase [Ruegeria spongiae]
MAQEVTILGAGAVGICTALSLAERGLTVRLIDRGDPGQETTFGNAGVISPWSFVPQSLPGLWRQLPVLMLGKHRPLSVRASYWPRMVTWGMAFLRQGTPTRVQQAADAMEVLCAPSIDLYRRHLRGTGEEALIRDCAYVHAFRDGSRASLDAIDYRIRWEKGGRLELVGSDELRRIEPALSHDFKAAVLIHGQARALAPGRLATVLADKARGLGVEVLRRDIRALRREATGWRIECGDETFAAQRVVVAMGAWSADLLQPLGISVPLAAERGYHLEFPDPGIELTNSVTDTDAKFVASSMEGGMRVAGQAEFGDVDAPPDPRKQRYMLAQARAALPDLNASNPGFWMGRRPSFPDSLPMIGGFEGHPGLFAGFGHSHYGLMMAPKTGELLADLLTARAPNIDLAAYSTRRFSRGLVPFAEAHNG